MAIKFTVMRCEEQKNASGAVTGILFRVAAIDDEAVNGAYPTAFREGLCTQPAQNGDYKACCAMFAQQQGWKADMLAELAAQRAAYAALPTVKRVVLDDPSIEL